MYTTILGLATQFAQATSDKEFDPDTVTPGIAGFLVTAFVGLAVVVIGFDMIRRIRRTNYKAEIGARLEAEVAERDAAEGGAADTAEGAAAQAAPDAATPADGATSASGDKN